MDWYIVYICACILIFPCIILGGIVSSRVNIIFDKYSKVNSNKGITSLDLAKMILDKAEINDVEIAEINGKLTDCYDSKHKVIKLSSSTINSTSIAALGVTAHELGHALQDKNKTFLFRFRTAFAPVVNFVSRAFVPLLVVGTLLSFVFYIPTIGNIICWASVGLYAASFLFYLITLPLESDASKKALKMLEELDILDNSELKIAKEVLRAALYTYVSAFTISLVYFLKVLSYAMMFAGDRKD